MGWSEAWNQLKQGNLTDAFSYAMVSDETIATDRETDRKLAALNAERAGRGFYDPETYRMAQGHLQDSGIDWALTNPASSPAQGAIDAIDEQVSAAASTIQRASTWTLGSILKLIPWPVWLALIGYGLFIGWPWIRPVLKRFAPKTA